MPEKATDAGKILEQYNILWQEQNEIYSAAAKHFGISESAIWILYFLRLSNGECSQKEIASLLFQPKQTINSAIKQLESRNIVELSAGSSRTKLVTLTQEGRLLAQKTSDHVLTAEQLAMGSLSAEERQQLIFLTAKYTENLRKRMGEQHEQEKE